MKLHSFGINNTSNRQVAANETNRLRNVWGANSSPLMDGQRHSNYNYFVNGSLPSGLTYA